MDFLTLKAIHLIAMVSWFAGIFYLPRLFVYHAMSEDQISLDRFHIMERKLYRGIMTPAMVITLVFGIWMLIQNPGFLQGGWMHAKLTLVALLVGYHFYCGYFVKAFKEQRVTKSHKFFRIFNEIPVLILIIVVFLVVKKPF